ncbi:MAG: hemolysin III family protein [Desulfobacteraceae bacterium]|nr:MAG: hemolysin III family protein [Desulfobacteraceae bacterium]
MNILKEPVNAISHMLGMLASIFGLILLIAMSSGKTAAWHVVSFSIFGLTLILMYGSSSLYHALRLSDRATMILRKIDHIFIFLLIAGTYTPFCLIPLRGPWGWSLFGVVWGIAFLGILLKISGYPVHRWVSTGIYLTMGWICLIAIYPLLNLLPPGCFFWMAMGGLSYSVGAVIYGTGKPDPWPGVFGFHEIWHLHVMLGSFCHFWAIYRYLMVFE